MSENMRDIDLLFEIGTMRHIERSWRQFGGASFANVAEHTFRVIWISLLLAQSEGANVEKTIKLALIHDLPETRTGDVNYVQRQYTDTNETQALHETTEDTSISKEMLQLWREYKSRQTLEAQIVKDADSLDCDLELQELKATGSTLPLELNATRNRVCEQLYTKSAKQLFNRILRSNCHDWHTKGRNRLNSGDWQAIAVGE